MQTDCSIKDFDLFALLFVSVWAWGQKLTFRKCLREILLQWKSLHIFLLWDNINNMYTTHGAALFDPNNNNNNNKNNNINNINNNKSFDNLFIFFHYSSTKKFKCNYIKFLWKIDLLSRIIVIDNFYYELI